MTDTNTILSRFYGRPVTATIDEQGRPIVVCAVDYSVVDGGDVRKLPRGFARIIRADRELTKMLGELEDMIQETDDALGL